MKVIALDPGVTTGYAVGHIQEGQPMGVVSGQIKWNELGLYNDLVSGAPDIIIYEEFESAKHNPYRRVHNYNVDLFPCMLIGVIWLYCYQHDIQPHSQTPAYGLGGRYKEDRVLQAESVFKVGKPHANDAMRHLLQWYTLGPGFKYDTGKKGFRPLA